jgi:hypothetical protein
MSNGSQIGGVIGAAVGLWVSGGNYQAAQLGYAIGPVLGERIEMAGAVRLGMQDLPMETPCYEPA